MGNDLFKRWNILSDIFPLFSMEKRQTATTVELGVKAKAYTLVKHIYIILQSRTVHIYMLTYLFTSMLVYSLLRFFY